MSKASRATKWRSRSSAWAGQIRPPVQRRTASPSSRTAWLPHSGQTAGGMKGSLPAGRLSSITRTTCGITSPARWTTTVSPARMSVACDLVLVVERRARDGDAADMHRLQLGHRRQRTGAPDRDRDPVQHGLGLLGGELVGDGPAGRPAGGAQTLLPVESVDLEDDTVDLEVERGPLSLDLPMERTRLVKTGATPGVRGERKPPGGEPREDIALPLPQRLAHLAPAVGEEAQPALCGERRVKLSQAAGSGVARIDECFFAFRLPFPVQRREIGMSPM